MFKRCIFKSVSGTFKIQENERHWKQCELLKGTGLNMCLLKSIFVISAARTVKSHRGNNHLNTIHCKNFGDFRGKNILIVPLKLKAEF